LKLDNPHKNRAMQYFLRMGKKQSGNTDLQHSPSRSQESGSGIHSPTQTKSVSLDFI
jgi:hypothetical protein